MTEQTTAPETEQPAPIVDALQTVTTSIAEFSKVKAGLADLAAKHPANLVCDVKTPAGMKEAIAGRAAWREPRVQLEQMRKAAKAPVLSLGKLIDSTAADLEAQLRIGESNYDAQIQVELTRKADEKAKAEEAERVRVQDAKDRIAAMFTSKPARLFGKPAADIQAAIVAMVAAPLADFGGFEDDAFTAKGHALDALRAMHTTQVAAEERAAEQARIAAEQAEQAAALAAQRAAFEAEQQAHRDALERKANELRAEQDAREAAARAEREKVEAEQRAERERIAAEQKVLDDAKRAEADRLAAVERARLDAEAAAAREQADKEAAERQHQADLEAEARYQAGLAAIQAEQAAAEKKRKAEAKAAAKLAAVQKAGPRLLAALKIAVTYMPQGAQQDEFADLIAEAEGAQ